MKEVKVLSIKKSRKFVDIDIVIPIVPKDHKYLARLLWEIEHSRRIPATVILASSSETEESLHKMKMVILSLNPSFHVIIESTPGTRLAGENRNVGAKKATASYIAFCDSDDSYSWNRLYRAAQIIEKHHPDLLIHSYSFQLPRLLLLFKLTKKKLADTKEIYEATFPNGLRELEIETGESGMSNLKLPPRFGEKYRIHHAHLIVKKSVPVEFGPKVRSEDGVFCRDLVFQGFNVMYTNEKLSNYERPNIFNVTRRGYRTASKIIRKFTPK
jgi:glycosyltransferase involved in cell wall biosynthesis